MNIQQATTEQQKKDAFFVRQKVFVEEQHVPIEQELDQFDEYATHFVGYEHDAPVAASRLRFVEGYGKLERIAVVKDYRGNSFGKQMILFMEDFVKEEGYSKTKLNAQTRAIGFYESLGYEVISDEEFMDAGIPHKTMTKSLS
ncbi:GNAT family N-acetyltransferase [Pontibacillus yanchengensis]|uniref:Acetyltransferase n=1 Tax=Pontibacillus yanchengensis Y32 TaxID=1385514 RepID=A0A0A2TYL8_9BACI|nr:GNAT family N-acetyltransferase [Pontibacillus yanchengensis]KGP74330.1 acetyltransferase [Pontibacillus yanchengensis Y32]